MSKESILQGLNPQQKEATVGYDAPSLIIAGAGSGKTRVLTSRIAYMLQCGVKPYNILALTFTNKAANEMRSRIETMVGSQSRYIWMGTFHSIFCRILRQNAERLDFQPTFSIYDSSDSQTLIKNLIKEMQLSDDHYKPNAIASRISMAKNNLLTPGAYAANSVLLADDRKNQIPEMGTIYAEYCRRCHRNQAMDFDDLLLETNLLFRDNPDVLARYQDLFHYILVDEYQDTNYAQYLIVKRLAEKHHNVCVVGDDAQSIYSFRGAKIENIFSFQKDYPEANIYRLEQNYRSTKTIVNAANSVIANNKNQMKKQCFSDGEEGDRIHIINAFTDREEADLVISDLASTIRHDDGDWSHAAILYRNNDQSRALEEKLRYKGIPYVIYHGHSFYDHAEVKDMLAYIRLSLNHDDDEAFRRVINTPARGIGATTVQRLSELASQNQTSLWRMSLRLLSQGSEDKGEKALIAKISRFMDIVAALSEDKDQLDLYNFGLTVANKSGILPALQMNRRENEEKIDNIEELLNTMQQFKEQCDAELRSGERDADNPGSLAEWMQNIMLLTDQDREENEDTKKVSLMTVHSAKGLEFKYVYIVGCEENLFPGMRAMESLAELEEERRLFYVALTRAEKQVTASYANMRFRWGQMDYTSPSRFLYEIDSDYVDSDTPLMPRRRQRNDEGDSAIQVYRRRNDESVKEKRNAWGSHPVAAVPKSVPMPTAGGKLKRYDSSASSGDAVQCDYNVGDQVRHNIFGHGVVTEIENSGNDVKIHVRFDDPYGNKTLLAKFAKLSRV